MTVDIDVKYSDLDEEDIAKLDNIINNRPSWMTIRKDPFNPDKKLGWFEAYFGFDDKDLYV